MADVQLSKGYFQIANRLHEAVNCADFTLTQMKIVHVLIRLTYGWKEKGVTVSVGYIAERCGLKDSGGFRRELAELLKASVIVEVEKAHGRTPSTFAVNKNHEQWGKFSIAETKLQALYGDRPVHGSLPPSSNPIKKRDTASDLDSPPQPSEATGVIESLNGETQAKIMGTSMEAATRLHGVTLDAPNSLNGETYEAGKKGNTVVVSTASKSLPPASSTAAAAAGDQAPPDHRTAKAIEAFAISMSTAANAAITKRFGEQPNPITFVTGLEIARILIDKGVHLETARSAIAGVVERFNGQRPMTSLAYFREAIERAHASRVQRGLNAADPTVPEVRGGPPSRIEPGNTSMHLPGVDGTAERNAREHAERLEYDAARQAATHAWSMAEENTAEYEQITADVNAAYAGMLDHETGKRARDAMVILTCAKRCGFPASFEAWRANREAAKQRRAEYKAERDPPHDSSSG